MASLHTAPDPWETVAPEWITREEVAAMTHLGLSTLKRWAQRGYGPPVYRPAPTLVRYRRAEVLAWMRSQRDAEFEPAAGV